MGRDAGWLRRAWLCRLSQTEVDVRLTSAQVEFEPAAFERLLLWATSIRPPPNDSRIDQRTTLRIAPRAVCPKARKREHVGAGVILAQQFHRQAILGRAGREFCETMFAGGHQFIPPRRRRSRVQMTGPRRCQFSMYSGPLLLSALWLPTDKLKSRSISMTSDRETQGRQSSLIGGPGGAAPSDKLWCRLRGLNPRPSVYKTAALPLS